jgi:hypothetical protein
LRAARVRRAREIIAWIIGWDLGIENAQEVCATHNFLKLWRAATRS